MLPKTNTNKPFFIQLNWDRKVIDHCQSRTSIWLQNARCNKQCHWKSEPWYSKQKYMKWNYACGRNNKRLQRSKKSSYAYVGQAAIKALASQPDYPIMNIKLSQMPSQPCHTEKVNLALRCLGTEALKETNLFIIRIRYVTGFTKGHYYLRKCLQ